MITAVTILIILVLFFVQLNEHRRTGSAKSRRLKAAFAWALLGAVLGSFAGLAAMGGAIAGTIPGAVVFYLIGSNLMKAENHNLAQAPDPNYQPINKDELNKKIENFANKVSQFIFLILKVLGFLLVIYIFILIAAYFVDNYNSPVKNKSQNNINQPSEGGNLNSAYINELVRLEGLYPQINPNSSVYDSKINSRAVFILKYLKENGVSPVSALNRSVVQAINEAAETQRPVNIIQPQIIQRELKPRVEVEKEIKQPCVYKSVMTDEDYMACGVRPPQSESD